MELSQESQRLKPKECPWALLPMPLRVDAFNLAVVEKRIESAVHEFNFLALDLATTQFLSMLFIQKLFKLSQKLEQRGGELVLIGAGERLKKQVHIFASLDSMKAYRSIEEWKTQASISELKDSHIF